MRKALAIKLALMMIVFLPLNTYAKSDDPAERIFVGAFSVVFFMIIFWIIGKIRGKKNS